VKKKRFGFDLDNTLIDYSQSTIEFCKINGLQTYETLKDLRNKIKFEMADDESWQSAQAWIYTEGLNYADLTDGTNDFFKLLFKHGFEISIISHKTSHTQKKYGNQELHLRTMEWLSSRIASKYFRLKENTYFEPTKNSKIERIKDLNIDYFVDDLKEILEDKNFPKLTRKYLLSIEKIENLSKEIKSVPDFKAISNDLNLHT
jgi:hypothetical protein